MFRGSDRMTKRFDLADLEKFVMNALDSRMYSHPDREAVKALIASRFKIYREVN